MKTLLTLSAFLFSSLSFAGSPCDTDCWEDTNRTRAELHDHINNHPVTHEETIVEVKATNPVASPSGWYAGGSLGASSGSWSEEISVKGNRYYAESATYGKKKRYRRTETVYHDETELAFRIYGGKEDILSIAGIDLGAELGYASLGDFGGYETDAIDLTATGRIGLGIWGLEALLRAGIAYVEAGNDEDGSTFVGAVGLTKDMSNHWRARLEYTRYDDAPDRAAGAVLLGVSHRF